MDNNSPSNDVVCTRDSAVESSSTLDDVVVAKEAGTTKSMMESSLACDGTMCTL